MPTSRPAGRPAPAPSFCRPKGVTNKVTNAGIWPQLTTDNGVGGTGPSSTPNSQSAIRLRTNAEAGNERVEICVVDRTLNNADNCRDETWLNVTSRGPVDLTSTITSTTPAAGAINQNGTYRWPAGTGSLNTSPFATPYVEFVTSRTNNWETSDTLDIQASFTNGSTFYTFAELNGGQITTSNGIYRLPLPFTSRNFVLRFVVSTNVSNEKIESLTVNAIRPGGAGITSSGNTPTSISPP